MRAERAKNEAQRLLAINEDWQIQARDNFNMLFRTELEFRRKICQAVFPLAGNQAER